MCDKGFRTKFNSRSSFFSFEVEKFARNTGLQFFRTSVKENLNISQVFYHLAEKYVESISRWSDEAPNAVYQIDSRQTEVRVRFAGLPNGDDSDGSGGNNNYARLYFSRRKKNGVNNSNNNGNSGGQQQQHHQYSQAINNKKNNKSHFNEMPFVVNRFYFHHDQSYPGSPFISPDKKVISLKLFDRKSQKRDKSGQTYPYYSCNRLIVAPNEKADAKNAVCNIL